MKMIHLHSKLTLAIAMTALTLACSSPEDNSLLAKPEIPATPDPTPDPTPEPHTPLHISNGVVTGIDVGYTEVVFPANVKRIQKNAFNNNKQIRKLTLNEGLEVIEEATFAFSSLEEINFPSTLKEVRKYAFNGCSNLSKADLSHTKISVLPEGLFGNSGLETVVLPTNLTDIGAQAFLNTTKLTSIGIPVNVKSIGNEAFRQTGATSVFLPNNLSSIGQRAFYLCPNLQEVKTHGKITQDAPDATIQESCFEGCAKLTVFEIPQNIRRIEQGILSKNIKVKSITIPANVNYIAFNALRAFEDAGLETVTVQSTTPPKAQLMFDIAWDAFPENVVSISVPAGTAETYKKAAGWQEFADKIQ